MEKNERLKANSLLVIVDVVNGFVREGIFANPLAENIIDENVNLAKRFLKAEQAVVAVRDCHREDSLEFKVHPPHCIEGTSEAELVDELKAMESEFFLINKNSTSTMFAPNFLKVIKNMPNLREVVVTGLCADICVLDTAIPLKKFFEQNQINVNVIVPENAVETFHLPQFNHDRDEFRYMAFRLMKQAGIEVVPAFEKELKPTCVVW